MKQYYHSADCPLGQHTCHGNSFRGNAETQRFLRSYNLHTGMVVRAEDAGCMGNIQENIQNKFLNRATTKLIKSSQSLKKFINLTS